MAGKRKNKSRDSKSYYILYVLLILAVVASLFVAFFKKSEKKRESPNVLLITIDTLRPDRLSCYGSQNQTPTLDEIARKGVLFENAFCQAPLTLPSHVSILTGNFPIRHAVHNNGLEILGKPEMLVSDAFRKAGYKTGAVVSSFVLDRKFGLSQSFDIYDDRMERQPGISSNFEVERPGNKTLDAAVPILESFTGRKWFLWVHFYDPHTPYAPPAPFDGYDGEVVYVDQQIGKLLQWLKAKNMDKDLVLAVLGDHGESLGEHGEATHGFFVYNSTLMIPLLLSYPGAPSQKRVAVAAAAVDIAPTLLELAGIQDREKRDGECLLSLIRGNKRKHDIFFESHYPELAGWNGLQGLIQANWKLISTTRSELYDWQNDVYEKTNLYTQKENTSRSLKQALQQLSGPEAPTAAQPDSETLEKLKSLGYISTTNVATKKGNADPKDKIAVWAEFEKSLQLKNAGKKSEALQILESLTKHERQNSFFGVSLAGEYRMEGRPSEALRELETVIRNEPSNEKAFYELALTYKDLRNFPEAIKAAQAALALAPERSEYHSVMGILLVETGEFEKAKEKFDQVLKRDPNNAVAWNNLGNALRETDHLQEAMESYRKSIDLSPNYAYPLNGLATILIRQDKIKEAIPYLEKAIGLDPEFVEVYLNLAIAYHTLGENEKAKTLYRTFLKIAPSWMKKDRENAEMLLSQLP